MIKYQIQIHKYKYTNANTNSHIQIQIQIQEGLRSQILTFLNQQLFRNIAYVWYSWHFNKAVFVYLYLYLCICVFDSWEYQF